MPTQVDAYCESLSIQLGANGICSSGRLRDRMAKVRGIDEVGIRFAISVVEKGGCCLWASGRQAGPGLQPLDQPKDLFHRFVADFGV